MDVSMRKIGVLYKKDFMDILKNISISISCVIPVFFAVLYKYLFSELPMPEGYLLSLILALNLTMGAVMIPATSIAEEKEKHTLRTLMLSNVSGLEFCVSKLLVTSSFMLITNLLIFFIMSVKIAWLPAFIVITVVCAFPVIVLGAVVGLAARDQMTAGVYEIPLMLVFLLPTIFADLNQVAGIIADFTPCHAMVQIVSNLTTGELASTDTILAAVVVIAWIIVAVVAFVALFKRKGVDN